MSSQAIFFLFWTLAAIVIQGMFALFEMACVSFHRIRLQYYVSRGEKRALWLNYLLQRPSRLFGTTLIGINTALQIGSECARQFYAAIHLDPDWAPISQVILVVIFAELSPLFAARRHPEQAAMALVPVMILFAKLLTPITWAFDALSRLIHKCLGKAEETPLFLSREEVRLAFQADDDGGDEFGALTTQIFQLKTKHAVELMVPLAKVQMVPATATVSEVRHFLSIHYVPFLPIYHRYPHNVVAVIHPRDLLQEQDEKKVLDLGKSPWFVSEATSVLSLIEQFRRNTQSIAVLLNPSGEASGIVALDDIVSSLFGREMKKMAPLPSVAVLHIERTLPGDMEVATFNREFQGDLTYFPNETLNDLILRELKHLPAKEETIRLGSYLFTVLEPSMRGAKTVTVRTLGAVQ
ncbi:MAG TPA: CNNM domain-containing protein [Chlamydiales bacterium]|nr:CNNM domain-containing protein [Chlamydiales bacterium]